MSVIDLKKIAIGLYLITFFNISFGAVSNNNKTQKKTETRKVKTTAPNKGTVAPKKDAGGKSTKTKSVNKQATSDKTAGSAQKNEKKVNEKKITKPPQKSSSAEKPTSVKTPAKTVDKKKEVKPASKSVTSASSKKTPKTTEKKVETKPAQKKLNDNKSTTKPLDKGTSDKKKPENKKPESKKNDNKSSVKKTTEGKPNSNSVNKSPSVKNLSDIEKDISKTKASIENGLSNKKENVKLLEKSKKMVDDKVEKDKQVDRVKIDKITKMNSEKILSFTKNSEEILASATTVSTENYKILFTGVNEINSSENSEITKATRLDTSFIAGFQVKNPEIELESVKVYLVLSEKSEKLLISSKVPDSRVKKEKGKPFVEEWATEVGKSSKIKGFGSEKDKNPISWNGESDIIGSVSLKSLLKDNKIDLEKVKISELKDLFALSDRKYRYLFKFVIKAKGKEEEVIFQPGILNIKLTGAKNIK